MRWPFVVFGLPRSRTAWLSHWLAGPGGDINTSDQALARRSAATPLSRVGHDLAIGARSVQELLDRLWLGRLGTVETAAVLGWTELRRAMPSGRVATIRRPIGECLTSLAKFGIIGVEKDLLERDLELDSCEAAGALRIAFGDLNDVNCCAYLWEFLRNEKFDFDWWQVCSQKNIQVNMTERLEALRSSAEAEAKLRADLQKCLLTTPPLIRIGLEPWSEISDEVGPLAAQHWRESGARPNFPLILNTPILNQLNISGALPIVTARADGRLIGYCFASISPDIESLGILQAHQGAWFVEKGFARVGLQMFERMRSILWSLGVQAIYLHSPMTGRGKKLSRYYERLGAKPYQQTYCLERSNA